MSNALRPDPALVRCGICAGCGYVCMTCGEGGGLLRVRHEVGQLRALPRPSRLAPRGRKGRAAPRGACMSASTTLAETQPMPSGEWAWRVVRQRPDGQWEEVDYGHANTEEAARTLAADVALGTVVT